MPCKSILSLEAIPYTITGKGPYILLLNGAFMGMDRWEPVRKFLEPYYTVIGIDFPNQGDASEDAHYVHQIDYAQYILDFIRLMNLKPQEISVLGLSFGANIARIMASDLKTNFKSAILIGCTPPNLSQYMNLFQEHLIQCLEKGGIHLFANQMALHLFTPGFLNQNPGILKIISDRFQESYHHRPESLKYLLQASLNYRKDQTAQQPDCYYSPIYIISSIEDLMISHSYTKKFADEIPAKGFYEIQAGHLAMAEKPKELNEILLGILNNVHHKS